MMIFLAFYLDDIVWLSPAFIKLYYIRGSVGLEKKDQQTLLTAEGNGMFFGRVMDLGSMEERTDSRGLVVDLMTILLLRNTLVQLC